MIGAGMWKKNPDRAKKGKCEISFFLYVPVDPIWDLGYINKLTYTCT